MTTLRFSEWLAAQSSRTDEIGELARWASQKGLSLNYRELRLRVQSEGSAVDAHLSVLQRAHIEFTDCPVRKAPEWRDD